MISFFWGGSMRKFLLHLCGIALLLVLSGCGSGVSEGEKSVREVLAATQDLADALQRVQDVNSAHEVAGGLDAKYTRLFASIHNFMEHKHAKMPVDLMDDLGRQIQNAQSKMKSEGQRLTQLRGLPISFWKICRMRSIELIVLSIGMNEGAYSGDISKSSKDLQELWRINSYEGVIQINMGNLTPDISQEAYRRIEKAADCARVIPLSIGNGSSAAVGPVADYKAFLARLDIGTVTCEDEGSRTISITVDRQKLSRSGNANADVAESRQRKNPQDSPSQIHESEARTTPRLTEANSKQAKPERESRVPNRNDPQYFEKLANVMIDHNNFYRDEAIDALLNATPSDVSSAGTRKKIAQSFKKLAEGEGHSDKKKAVKGLVIWGGKFSVPILLKMLDDVHGSDQEEIIKALGDLKDPQAAVALTARLGDFFTHDAAYAALKQIGSAAEEALLAAAPSDDPKICLSAINLLGEVGADKSFPLLRQAQSSKNPEVRSAAKDAMKKIAARKNKAKSASL
jgi:hypothetical protein